MHKKLLSVLAGLLLFASLHAQTVPTPDHVVLLIMENHSYAEIIGSNTGAPYINSLAADSFGAILILNTPVNMLPGLTGRAILPTAFRQL